MKNFQQNICVLSGHFDKCFLSKFFFNTRYDNFKNRNISEIQNCSDIKNEISIFFIGVFHRLKRFRILSAPSIDFFNALFWFYTSCACSKLILIGRRRKRWPTELNTTYNYYYRDVYTMFTMEDNMILRISKRKGIRYGP